MKEVDKVVVRTKALLSYAGEILEKSYIYNGLEMLLLKPSNKSDLIIMIPINEISEIFYMDGKVGKEND